MSEVINVDAVTTKFANKYNSGSVKVGDKWYQVSKNIDISVFRKDQQIEVETKTNDKGYTSIVKVFDDAPAAPKVEEKPVKTTKRVSVLKDVETTTSNGTTPIAKTYEENKNRRILVQGLTQAAMTSPSLAGVPFTSVSEVAANVKALAKEMIQFVEEESR